MVQNEKYGIVQNKILEWFVIKNSDIRPEFTKPGIVKNKNSGMVQNLKILEGSGI